MVYGIARDDFVLISQSAIIIGDPQYVSAHEPDPLESGRGSGIIPIQKS